ncbi:unnamed protein product [Allacma fusca]|uniref:Uncharacterized protein n=1 Tax=Allacma fusca TaxID=39272 RepID=A0A8J2NTV1_9HEXA|nr:unnamed protein product [Allacma fusca]
MARLSHNPRAICNCTGFHQKTIDKNSFVESKCSDEATLAGTNQHVITFSFYSKPESVRATKKRYFDGILPNLKVMKKIYPGWIMRVHTNASYTPEVCDLVCADEKLFFCDIRGLQRFAPHVESVDPMLWRSIPMGDPTVKIFASRDLDSRLSQREKDAVDQWEDSGYPIHGMRDHPLHLTEIMGGMWGADNYKLCLDVAQEINFHMMQRVWKQRSLNDQQILSHVVYGQHKNKILTHDSYTCNVYNDSIPFPTKRPQSKEYVQRIVVIGSDPTALDKMCPVACRPSYGQNWDYC